MRRIRADHLLVRDILTFKVMTCLGTPADGVGSFRQDLSLVGLVVCRARSGAFWGFSAGGAGFVRAGSQAQKLWCLRKRLWRTDPRYQDFDTANAIAREGYVLGAMVIDVVHFVPQSRPPLIVG
jgi:DNA (cytosine-5)-methyltransferase 1